MAVIKKDGNTMGLPMNITRGNPIPIDSTSIWYSLAEAQAYAASGATAYVGQILTVVNESRGSADVYVIADTAGNLINLSSSSGSSWDLGDELIIYGGSASDVIDEGG